MRLPKTLKLTSIGFWIFFTGLFGSIIVDTNRREIIMLQDSQSFIMQLSFFQHVMAIGLLITVLLFIVAMTIDAITRNTKQKKNYEHEDDGPVKIILPYKADRLSEEQTRDMLTKTAPSPTDTKGSYFELFQSQMDSLEQYHAQLYGVLNSGNVMRFHKRICSLDDLEQLLYRNMQKACNCVQLCELIPGSSQKLELTLLRIKNENDSILESASNIVCKLT